MNKSDLDKLLFNNTDEEKLYISGQYTSSPRFAKAKTVLIGNKKVMYLHHENLESSKIIMRKDSRYIAMPFYTYSSININYIYSGGCTYWIDGEKLELKKGDVCIFDKGVVRGKDRTGWDDIIINLNISDQHFQKSVPKLENQNIISTFLLSRLMTDSSNDNYIVFRTNEDEKIMELFDQLLIEYYENRPYSKEIMQNYLSIITMELLLLYQTREDIHSVHLSSKSDNKVLEILFYIENNYASCSLKDVAEHFGYHEKYLSTYIKRYSGKSFQEIKKETRLKESAWYLLNTELPVCDISEKVGYTNRSQFYKEFKAAYHMLPTKYRQTKQESMDWKL